MARTITKLGLAAFFCLAAFAAAAEDDYLAEAMRSSFFHLMAEGEPSEGSLISSPSHGKAFAVGPRLLVAPQHVIGRLDDWEHIEDPQLPDRLIRVLPPIDRNVTITGVSGSELERHFDMPSPSPALDVAGISAPGSKFEHPFQLSICPIKQQLSYRAVLVNGNPADPANLGDTELVSLKASGFKPDAYGPLYVFEIEQSHGVKLSDDGHDGSPIVDESGFVVGMVSAIVKGGDKHQILATPVQPLFPGTSGAFFPKPVTYQIGGSRQTCSLAEMVGRIQQSVSRHADWRLTPERDRDGNLTGTLTLRYDSLSLEPHIAEIEIEATFIGKEKGARPRIDRVGSAVEFDRTSKGWEFDLNQIILEGRALEDNLREANKGGYILYVQIYIEPTKLHPDDVPIENVPITVREFQWK